MGLLDGDLAGIFHSAFAGVYLDATLHRRTTTPDGKGGGTVAFVDEAVKAQLDRATEAMRSSEGYQETDVRIIVLAHGIDPIDSDCQLTVSGQRWSIANVAKDPADAAYELHGRKA